jgi:hypothetical protein
MKTFRERLYQTQPRVREKHLRLVKTIFLRKPLQKKEINKIYNPFVNQVDLMDLVEKNEAENFEKAIQYLIAKLELPGLSETYQMISSQIKKISENDSLNKRLGVVPVIIQMAKYNPISRQCILDFRFTLKKTYLRDISISALIVRVTLTVPGNWNVV